MDTSLYVGNFPYSTTESDLANLFTRFGQVVRTVVITDYQTGRSKGYGFVEMSNSEEAATAKSEMDGQDFGGRPIRVNDATPRAATGHAATRPTHDDPESGSVGYSKSTVSRPRRVYARPAEDVVDDAMPSRGYHNPLLEGKR